MKKYDVPVAMKPYQTLKNVLVHPKDKQNKEEKRLFNLMNLFTERQKCKGIYHIQVYLIRK